MDQREPGAVSVDAGTAPQAAGDTDVTVMTPASTVEVALLDRVGRIVAVNAAWQRFGVDNGGDPSRCGVGASYLDVCDADDDPVAVQVGCSVRAALRGDLPAPLAVEVPCHSPDTWRWFDLLVSLAVGRRRGVRGGHGHVVARPRLDPVHRRARRLPDPDGDGWARWHAGADRPLGTRTAR